MFTISFLIPKEMDEAGNIKYTAFYLDDIEYTKNYELDNLECYLVKGSFNSFIDLKTFLNNLKRNYSVFSTSTLQDDKYVELVIEFYEFDLSVVKKVLKNGTLIQIKNRIEKGKKISVLMVKSSNLKDLLFETKKIIKKHF